MKSRARLRSKTRPWRNYSNVITGKVNWKVRMAANFSEDSKQLIKRKDLPADLAELLQIDPKQRLSIEEILVHPWIIKKEDKELAEARLAFMEEGKGGFSPLFASTTLEGTKEAGW